MIESFEITYDILHFLMIITYDISMCKGLIIPIEVNSGGNWHAKVIS